MPGGMKESRHHLEMLQIQGLIRDAAKTLGVAASLCLHNHLDSIVVTHQGEEGVVDMVETMACTMMHLMELEGWAGQLVAMAEANDPRRGNYGKPPTGRDGPPDKAA